MSPPARLSRFLAATASPAPGSERNPRHFGALSGYGLIYIKRGELEHALEYFERALAIDPNLRGVEESIELIRYKMRKEGKEPT